MASSEFARKVAEVVRRIPEGTVLSYGEVALLAGKPGAARAVVKALGAERDLPWWRVVRADRTLAEPVAAEQARRLGAEGVEVEGRRLVRGRCG
jgi:methylated-DNA-protein-cysteine methyltransferase-like protein